MIYQLVGRRSVGKSTLALYLARQTSARVIIDPRGLFRGAPVRAENADEVSECFDRLTAGEIQEFAITAYDDPQALFRSSARHLQTWARGRTVRPLSVIVDEVRDADAECAAFDWVRRGCPRDKMHVLFTCHRPVDIPTRVRAIADHWCIFRTTQTHDLKSIEERCSTAVATTVGALQGRQFVHWNDEIGEMRISADETAWYTSLDGSAGKSGDLAGLPWSENPGKPGRLQF